MNGVWLRGRHETYVTQFESVYHTLSSYAYVYDICDSRKKKNGEKTFAYANVAKAHEGTLCRQLLEYRIRSKPDPSVYLKKS
jgi:hypothetical protein